MGSLSRWRLTRYKPPMEEYSRNADQNSLLSGSIGRCRKRRAQPSAGGSARSLTRWLQAGLAKSLRSSLASACARSKCTVRPCSIGLASRSSTSPCWLNRDRSCGTRRAKTKKTRVSTAEWQTSARGLRGLQPSIDVHAISFPCSSLTTTE
jgi:hypothetical protein